MALTTTADYHFADTTGIDISGEVLPQHPDEWRVNRGEDFAFFCEMLGERASAALMLGWPQEYGSLNAAEAEIKSERRFRDVFTCDPSRWQPVRYKVPSVRNLAGMLARFDEITHGYEGCSWCNGRPPESSGPWPSEGTGVSPDDGVAKLIPEMYPSPGFGGLVDFYNRLTQVGGRAPWTVDVLRTAYDAMLATQFVCVEKASSWFDNSAVTHHVIIINSDGRYENDRPGWVCYASVEYANRINLEQVVPGPVQPRSDLPLGFDSSGGQMLTFWSVAGEDPDGRLDPYRKWYTKATSASYDFTSWMASLVSSVPRSYRKVLVSGAIVGYVMEASNLRTYIAPEEPS